MPRLAPGPALQKRGVGADRNVGGFALYGGGHVIVADARSRFTAQDINLVAACVSRLEGVDGPSAFHCLEVDGLDTWLDRSELRAALVAAALPGPSSSLLFYVLVRQALLQEHIDSPVMADYCAALVREFGVKDRAHRIGGIDDHRHGYLIDILQDLSHSHGERHFRVLVHLGNYALWIAGVFPDRIEAQRIRRGGPDLTYYESLGYRGYAEASDHALADRTGLAAIFRTAADRFQGVRRALNVVSDQLHLRPAA